MQRLPEGVRVGVLENVELVPRSLQLLGVVSDVPRRQRRRFGPLELASERLELDALGLAQNTIVVYTSDHGEMAGAHGLRGKGPFAYRETTHLPMTIVHPDVTGGRSCKALSGHIDFAPTLLAFAGATPAQVAKQAPYAKSGPYAAGVTTLRLDDREVEVWYPTTKDSVRGKRKDSYYISDWLPKAIQDLLVGKGINPPFRTDAYRGVPAAKGRFPLIVFEHGFGGYRDQSTFLTTHLATWGFVVASPDFLERGLAAQLGGAPATPKTGLQVFDETVAKVRAASAAKRGVLSGHVKPGKLGVTGHSAGARGTIEVATEPDASW